MTYPNPYKIVEYKKKHLMTRIFTYLCINSHPIIIASSNISLNLLFSQCGLSSINYCSNMTLQILVILCGIFQAILSKNPSTWFNN